MATRRRPRTRVYDCNFNIGQSYYKPVMDSLDRKYSGRTQDPVTAMGEMERESTPVGRLSKMMDREREGTPSNRASKLFAELESNGVEAPLSSFRSRAPPEDDGAIDAEFEDTMKRIRAARAARNAELEEEFDNFAIKKKINIADGLLDSVGLNSRAQRAIEDDVIYKQKKSAARRFLEEDGDDKVMAKWTAVRPGARAMQEAEDNMDESGAVARARKSRARIQDIDTELEELAAKGAARQKRIQELRALVGEDDMSSNSAVSSSVKVTKRVSSIKSSSEKKQVSF